MRRRLTIIITSLAVAAVGAVLLLRTSSHERDEALAGIRSSSVLVATERIEPGTPAGEAAASVERAEVPESALVPGALTDLEQVAGLRAVGPILPGQQVVADQWQSGASALQPPPGRLGVSVQLSDPARVAGFVVPGSRVAVFATMPEPTGGLRTRLLLAPITVLGVGGSALATRTTEADGETSTEQVPSAILTLALTAEQAERVVLATSEGQVHLGLIGDRAPTSGTAGAGVTAATLFGGAP